MNKILWKKSPNLIYTPNNIYCKYDAKYRYKTDRNERKMKHYVRTYKLFAEIALVKRPNVSPTFW